jgi:hypothetical protein
MTPELMLLLVGAACGWWAVAVVDRGTARPVGHAPGVVRAKELPEAELTVLSYAAPTAFGSEVSPSPRRKAGPGTFEANTSTGAGRAVHLTRSPATDGRACAPSTSNPRRPNQPIRRSPE